jgi:L-alanine-DL-glutamate epimerase-like enolase superfamily enzyme
MAGTTPRVCTRCLTHAALYPGVCIVKIGSVTVQKFRYRSNVVRDSDGHGHPGPEHDAVQSMLTISTDDGASGYYFGAVDTRVFDQIVTPILLGEHPLYRERIWHALKERQRVHLSTLPDRVLTAVDLALWDLAGQVLGQPVHRLLGGARDKVPAYASTMVSRRCQAHPASSATWLLAPPCVKRWGRTCR